jgi:hypothetical protein
MTKESKIVIGVLLVEYFGGKWAPNAAGLRAFVSAVRF